MTDSSKQSTESAQPPFVASALFTPEEWVTAMTVSWADKEAEVPEATTLDTLIDELLYGARQLSDAGYEFQGFRFEGRTDGNRSLEVRTTVPLGAAPALLGIHPTRRVQAAHDWLIDHLPEEADMIDRVKSLLEHVEGEWGEVRQ